MGRLSWIMLMALAVGTHSLSIQPTNHLGQPRHKRDTNDTNYVDAKLIEYFKTIIEKSELIGNLTTVIENQTKVLQQTKDEVQNQTKEMMETLSKPLDCLVWSNLGYDEDGVYKIWPLGESKEGREVWCDMTTEGGGWTLVLKRQIQDNPIDFARTWQEYADGFGIAAEEYWLGNHILHTLTKDRPQQLRVEARDAQNGEVRFAEWASATVADEAGKFAMQHSRRHYNTNSTMGRILSAAPFSTIDRKNDEERRACAEWLGQGGWWYGWGCRSMNPTAPLPRNSRYYLGQGRVKNHEAYTDFWAGDGIGSRAILDWVQVKIRTA